jgi:ABC-type glycerol-3-phosphate transport system substrate-binding protein
VMNVNADIFEEQGLDYPDSYNDLFDSQYEGLKTVLPDFVVGKELGWIVKYHADERGMEPVAWMEELVDHLDFVGAENYGPAIRSVAQGEAAIDFHNFPWFASSFIQKYDSLHGVFVDPVKEEAFGGDLAINRHAPNPWEARFLASAYFETSVQRRLVTDVTDQVPARTDALDIGSMNLDDYTKRRLTTETDLLGFYELNEYSDVYKEVQGAGVLEDY